ncbi:MAG: dihydropteroate synthase [Candidatus Latescibacteria bacterium]|nr:dihydropteroate synthase [Candidatus Latescibacterota bacterium]
MIWQLGERTLDFRHRLQVMGILNTTPDSFFDGGAYLDPARAVERGLQLEAEGADLIDVGGESTRPPLYGERQSVDAEEECRRVLPVIEGLRRQTRIPISIDTTKAEVARRALEAGADIVNDISALRDDPGLAAVADAHQAPVILMHRPPPALGPGDPTAAVRAFLAQRLEAARQGGLTALAVDPGLGFGKSLPGNFALLRRVEVFAGLGCPVLVGASRKSFIWKTLDLDPAQSLEGSLAVATLCAAQGVHLLRVHDVKETVRAVRVAHAVARA